MDYAVTGKTGAPRACHVAGHTEGCAGCLSRGAEARRADRGDSRRAAPRPAKRAPVEQQASEGGGWRERGMPVRKREHLSTMGQCSPGEQG